MNGYLHPTQNKKDCLMNICGALFVDGLGAGLLPGSVTGGVSGSHAISDPARTSESSRSEAYCLKYR